MATVSAEPYRTLLRKRTGSAYECAKWSRDRMCVIAAKAGIPYSLVKDIIDGKRRTIEVKDAASIVMSLEGTIVLPGAGGGAV